MSGGSGGGGNGGRSGGGGSPVETLTQNLISKKVTLSEAKALEQSLRDRAQKLNYPEGVPIEKTERGKLMKQARDVGTAINNYKKAVPINKR